MTKNLLITHSTSCMDGKMCAAIYHQYMTDNDLEYEIKFTQYGEDSLDMELVKDKNVIMADFSYPVDILDNINYNATNFILLDHHKLPKEISDLPYAIIDRTKCGSLLLWEYLYPDTEIPELILAVDARDRWTQEWQDNKYQLHEVHAALNLIKYDDYDKLLSYLYNIHPLKSAGSSILQYQKTIVDGTSKKVEKGKTLRVEWCGHNVPLINTNTLISEIGNEVSKNESFAVMFFFTNDSIVFSFRSDGNFDGTELGFQGHPSACGCSFPLETFNFDMLFKDKKINLDYILENRR